MISSKLLKESLLVNISEDEIVSRLAQISNTFNIDRAKIEKMYSEPKNISSYTYFYLPTNMYKMRYLFDHLNQNVIERISNTSVIDIGCGPGTYVFALIEILKNEAMNFFGVDQNKFMLEQARKIHESHYSNFNISWSKELPVTKDDKTLVFGNSINEMGADQALKIIKKLDPKIVICIEPGTKSTFSEIKKLRDALIKDDLRPIFPCPSSSSCPMRNDNWCHQTIRVSLDKDIERLGQKIKKDRTKMPAIVHVYCRDVEDTHKKRVIRLEKKAKHAFIWNTCESAIEENKFMRIEVLKKPLSKSWQKSVEKLSSGFSIEYEVQKELGENSRKVVLTQVEDEEIS